MFGGQAQIVLLRKEGTEKYQLEERDDWRALVESLTSDRKNLNKRIAAAAKVSDNILPWMWVQHSTIVECLGIGFYDACRAA